MKYIRDYYNVPAKRGMRVIAQGEPGEIVGSRGQYLRIRIGGCKRVGSYHPMDGIEYANKTGEVDR